MKTFPRLPDASIMALNLSVQCKALFEPSSRSSNGAVAGSTGILQLLHLLCSDPRELAGRFYLATHPFWRNIEAVRPGRRAELEKDARKIGRVPQRFEHGARLIDHRSKVVHAFAAVVETDAQPEAAEPFETY